MSMIYKYTCKHCGKEFIDHLKTMKYFKNVLCEECKSNEYNEEKIIQNKNIKHYLQKRIEHANKRVRHIEESHGDNPGETHTYFAGKSLGYYKGLLEAYRNCLDEINENDKKE